MRPRLSFLITPITIIVDSFLLNVAFYWTFIKSFQKELSLDSPEFIFVMIYCNLIWITIALLLKIYHFSRTIEFYKTIKPLILAVLIHIGFFSLLVLLQNDLGIEIRWFLSFYAKFLISFLVWRAGSTYFIHNYRRQGGNYRNIIIVGYGELSEELKVVINSHPEYGYKFKGVFDNTASESETLGKIDDVEKLIKEGEVDEILCCIPYIRYEVIQEIIDFAEDNLVKVKLVSDFRGFSTRNIELERFDHIPVLNVSSIPLDNSRNKFLKRIFDIFFSLIIILLVLSWTTPLLYILIKLESRGPLLFKQKRTGLNNQNFICYKFRTMAINSQSDLMQASKNDSRITKIGAFLRKTSIDEMPQFLNVLKGEMSVVGPRPHMLVHTQEYSKIVDKFMSRHNVKPGITGLAQMKGYRGETKDLLMMKNRVRMDRFYINNWSLLLDIKIIIQTIVSIFQGQENAH
ncbi:MAG: undecaprenyl-phosphate glucose phosphotransferase [Bacteroidota bacterium]